MAVVTSPISLDKHCYVGGCMFLAGMKNVMIMMSIMGGDQNLQRMLEFSIKE